MVVLKPLRGCQRDTKAKTLLTIAHQTFMPLHITWGSHSEQILGPTLRYSTSPGLRWCLFSCFPKTPYPAALSWKKQDHLRALHAALISAWILLVPREDHITASPEMAFSAHYVLVERIQRRQWYLSEAVHGKQQSPVHESSVTWGRLPLKTPKKYTNFQ